MQLLEYQARHQDCQNLERTFRSNETCAVYEENFRLNRTKELLVQLTCHIFSRTFLLARPPTSLPRENGKQQLKEAFRLKAPACQETTCKLNTNIRNKKRQTHVTNASKMCMCIFWKSKVLCSSIKRKASILQNHNIVTLISTFSIFCASTSFNAFTRKLSSSAPL